MRPVRPSTAKNASRGAEQFLAEDGSRLSIRISKATLREIRKTAVNADRSVKRFVLEALRDKGVAVAEQDLAEDGER